MTAEWIDGVRMSDRKGLERLVNGTISDTPTFTTKNSFLTQLDGETMARKELNGHNWDSDRSGTIGFNEVLTPIYN